MTPLDRATPLQRQALEAYVRFGSMRSAARALGLKDQAFRHRMLALYRRTGARNAAEAAFWLGQERRAA